MLQHRRYPFFCWCDHHRRHHQTLHFAPRSGFPSHFLQLLNVNIILRVLACRGFHTAAPEHRATGRHFRNQIHLCLLETAHLRTQVKERGEKNWPKSQIVSLAPFPSGINAVQNTAAHRSDKFPRRLPRPSFLSRVYQLLFTTHTRKTRREHVRTHYCILPSCL